MRQCKNLSRRCLTVLMLSLVWAQCYLTACSQVSSPRLDVPKNKLSSTVIYYSGSTIAYNLMRGLGREYQKNTKIDLQAVGIPEQAAIQRLSQGKSDIAVILNPNHAIPASQRGEFKITAFAADGISVGYNIQDKKLPLHFTGTVLADIFRGQIKRWDNPRIRTLNRSARLPKTSIIVIRPDGSTFLTYASTSYLSLANDLWKKKVGSGYAVEWPTGISPHGINGETVLRIPNAIEFVSTVTATALHIPSAPIMNRAGNFVVPTSQNISDALRNSPASQPFRSSSLILNAPGKNAYPLVYRLFIVTQKRPQGRGVSAEKFAHWILRHGASVIRQNGFVPLQADRGISIDINGA